MISRVEAWKDPVHQLQVQPLPFVPHGSPHHNADSQFLRPLPEPQKYFRIIAFSAVFKGLGLSFTYFWGPGSNKQVYS